MFTVVDISRDSKSTVRLVFFHLALEQIFIKLLVNDIFASCKVQIFMLFHKLW